MNECKKFDAGKPQMAFLPWGEVADVARVLDFGAAKYGRDNWRKGCAWSRYTSAAFRHIAAWQGGEANDPESGLPHLAHAMCCLLFLAHYEKWNIGTDDREPLVPPELSGGHTVVIEEGDDG